MTVSAAVFSAVQALTYPLLAIILVRDGSASASIGVNAAMTPLGVLLAAPLIPALLSRGGGARWVIASLCLTLGCLFLIGASRSALAWLPLRLVLGMCLSCVFVASETWVNQLADERRRGFSLGVYSTVLSAGFAAGPLCLVIAGTHGWPPFFAGAALVLVALAPIVWLRRELPCATAEPNTPVLKFMRQAPLLLICVLLVALADESALSMLPVYLLDNGMASHMVNTLLAVMIAGSIVLQFPIGWAADRLGHFWVAGCCASISALCSGLLIFTADSALLVAPFLFVWGGAYYGLYTISLVQLGNTFSGARLAAGNAAFGMMWGLGGLIGPSFVGGIMDWSGSIGFPLVFTALFGCLFLSLAWTRLRGG